MKVRCEFQCGTPRLKWIITNGKDETVLQIADMSVTLLPDDVENLIQILEHGQSARKRSGK